MAAPPTVGGGGRHTHYYYCYYHSRTPFVSTPTSATAGVGATPPTRAPGRPLFLGGSTRGNYKGLATPVSSSGPPQPSSGPPPQYSGGPPPLPSSGPHTVPSSGPHSTF
ncbi:hypothetical protein OTU49_012959 [Cherax quadricarinatus]|uniref:Uncharacterized protein n=1 Tax=Cherax quadricarinatus TaxID=27406 RepID=A0AAW0Y2S1_CHEQU